MTVVTGFPGSGKSDLIDQVCINAAKNHNWKTVYCSFEKPPHLHMAQLCAKITGKPFFEGLNPRMTVAERDQAKAWISQHFVFMDYMAGAPADIDGILEFAKADLGLTVVRTDDGPEAHVWKARWQWLGKMGSANLAFDPVSSRWSDRQRNLPQVPDNFDWDI